jgi:hypothetical protein
VDGDDVPSWLITQLKLEMLLGMRRELHEMEESIAIALSKGAHIEPGIHKPELIPVRKNGKLYLRLVIR